MSLEKPKIEVHIFDKATLSGFAMREFRTKKDFNAKKQVLLLIKLRPCLLKKKTKKHNLFSMKKIFIQKKFVAFRLSAFCFEISSFSSPGCCISFILHLLLLVCGIQSMAQFYRCTSIEAGV